MKVLMILPEFEEGGVERHVLWLASELYALGHSIVIATAGGKLEKELPPEIPVIHLPVHRKNPVTAFFSALRIASMARHEGIDLLHAHSRVPAWIAWWTSAFSGRPWIFTAHARYRKNAALGPFRKAQGAICISEAVKKHLGDYLPANTAVIRNGIPDPSLRWKKREKSGPFRFLFVGRLTRLKGLHVALSALSSVKTPAWELVILGDGPQREEIEAMTLALGLGENVHFQGFCDDVEKWMAVSDCLLFPSLDEGMGLTLMQGIRVGIPVLASDIEPVRELVGERTALLPAGDIDTWKKALGEVASREREATVYDSSLVQSTADMAYRVEGFFRTILQERKAGLS